MPRTMPYDVLFSVGDVARTLYGGILVADPQEGTWFTLDLSLRVVGATGGFLGRDPGAFGDLSSLRTLGSNQYALDRLRRRINVYSPILGQVRPPWVSLDFEPVDLCPISRNRLIVLGEYEGKLLHEVDVTSGQVIRSGLPADGAISDPDDGRLPDGWMSCDAGSREFLITWAGFPVVDAVDVQTLQLISRDLIPSSPGGGELSAIGRAFTYKGERVVQASRTGDMNESPDSVFLFHRGLQSDPRVMTGHQRLFAIGGDSAVLVTGADRFRLQLVKLSQFLKTR